MKLTHLFFIVCFLCCISCKRKVIANNTTNAPTINFSDLLGKWFHSHEEDQKDIITYRPENFDFPPARGRRGCNFIEKGGYEQYEIAPTDGLQTIKGSWTKKDDKSMIINLYTHRKLVYKLEIIELNKQILRFKISNLNN